MPSPSLGPPRLSASLSPAPGPCGIFDELELDELELDELELVEPEGEPGTPGWADWEEGVPSGGAAFAGCAASHASNCERETTWTVERMKACPGPQSSVHSTG